MIMIILKSQCSFDGLAVDPVETGKIGGVRIRKSKD